MFDDDFMKRAEAHERAWDERLGGDVTRELRFMLGFTVGRLVEGNGVKPEDLIEYIRGIAEGHGEIPPPLKSV